MAGGKSRSTAFLVLGGLVLLSAAALFVTNANGWTLYYGDAEAHLNIARRMIDSRTPGYDQVGTVWLPLPHWAMIPLVRVDSLWRSGLEAQLVHAHGARRGGRLGEDRAGEERRGEDRRRQGRAPHSFGLSAVKSEQQGFITGWNSISSTRVPSGS